LALDFLVPCLRADRDFMNQVVRRNGFALRFASDELRSDADLVMAALQQDPRAIKYVDRKSMLSTCHSSIRKMLEVEHTEQTPIRCPMGHELQQLRVSEGNYACDSCGRALVGQRWLWSCCACCFDLCLDCNKSEEAALGAEIVSSTSDAVDQPACCQQAPCLSKQTQDLGAQAALDIYMVGSWDAWRDSVKLQLTDSQNGSCFKAQVPISGLSRVERFHIFDASSCWVSDACASADVDVHAGTRRLPAPSRPWQQTTWKVSVPVDATFIEVVVHREQDGLAVQCQAFGSPQASVQEPCPCKVARCWPTYSPFFVCGSWDGWQGEVKMQPCVSASHLFCGSVHLGGAPVPQLVRFQILQDRDRSLRFHPDLCQEIALGPDADAASCWEVRIPAGSTELRVFWDPRGKRRIDWQLFGAFGTLQEVPRPVSTTRFFLIGTWDGWQGLVEFLPAGRFAFHAHIEVRASPGVEEFQVLQDKDWQQRFCPSKNGEEVIATSRKDSASWKAGIPRRCRWLRVTWQPFGERRRISWSYLSAQGENVDADRHARAVTRIKKP